MRDPGERQQVVLADRPERDVTSEYQLVVGLVVGERGRCEGGRGEQLRIGAGHPQRRVGELVLTDVDTQREEELPCGSGRRRQIGGRVVPEGPQGRAHRGGHGDPAQPAGATPTVSAVGGVAPSASLSRSATRIALAMIVRVGLTAVLEQKKEESTT